MTDTKNYIMSDTENYKKAFVEFLNSTEIRVAIRVATELVDSSIYVELFNGTYRVLYSVGNRYDTKGLMIGIPGVSDEEWDDDYELICYENAINEIETKFEQKMLDLVD
jgi:hypothetical protein